MTLVDVLKLLRVLGVRLVAAFAMSLALMLLANENPFARYFACNSLHICLYANGASGWNKVIYDLSSGCAVSLFFYWLLVRWPDHKRRVRIRASFAAQHRTFKLSCIETFLMMSDKSYTYGFPEELLKIEKFREYFDEDIGDRDTRWYQVANGLDEFYLAQLVTRMEIFREEITFVLHNVDIQDPQVMEFFKRFSRIIYAYKNVTPEHGDVKSFCGFMWSVFSGWSFVDGYPVRDIFEVMIESV